MIAHVEFHYVGPDRSKATKELSCMCLAAIRIATISKFIISLRGLILEIGPTD